MVRSIKQLYGNKLGASDGDIGHVKDFYFDDQSWAICHLVIDTGQWLSGKEVLVSPSQVERISSDESRVVVNLTKGAILKAPIFDPVSFGIVEHDPRVRA